MLKVVIESPFKGETPEQELEHIKYVRRAMHDCLMRGEAPFASHALYTLPDVLDDDVPDERKLGMNAGFEWGKMAEKVVVYVDYGASDGMEEGRKVYEERGIPVEYRQIGRN